MDPFKKYMNLATENTRLNLTDVVCSNLEYHQLCEKLNIDIEEFRKRFSSRLQLKKGKSEMIELLKKKFTLDEMISMYKWESTSIGRKSRAFSLENKVICINQEVGIASLKLADTILSEMSDPEDFDRVTRSIIET